MEYYQALQLADKSGYHYTCTNGAGTFPLGYCCSPSTYDRLLTPWEAVSKSTRAIYMTQERYEKDLAIHQQFHSKYHTHGHATSEAAHDCYREYLVDQCVEIYEDKNRQEHCKECGVWTQQRVTTRGAFRPPIPLCEQHQKREFLLKYIFRFEGAAK